MIKFSIPGPPVGKGRPRFARRGNFVTTYTPEKTASYESLVKLAASEAMAGRQITESPCSMQVDIIMPIPASWSKKKQALAKEGGLLPIVKPDWDNVGKCISDACNGIVYKDDSQLVDVRITKQYGPPGVLVSISEIAF